MKAPTLKVGNKVYTAKDPKVRLWRKIVEYNKTYGKVEDMHSNIEAYEAMIELIAMCYGLPEITPEVIEDNLSLGELMPTLIEVTTWVANLLSDYTKDIPGKN